MLYELLEQFVLAAADVASNMYVVHVGPTARYLMMDPSNGNVLGFVVGHGTSVCIPRCFRLLVEPVAYVNMRTPDEVERWVTQ